MESNSNPVSEPVAVRKTSKGIIVLFVIAIIGIAGLLVNGVMYETTAAVIINIVISGVLIWLTLYAMKYAKKKNLNGLKMAKFAFWAFSAVLLIEVVGAIILAGYARDLRAFATTTTPGFFAEELSGLKENATPELQKVLAYEDETAAVAADFAEAGAIEECVQERYDFNAVSFGPYFDFNSLKIGMLGTYSVRCYGETKPFDFYAETKHEDGGWHVDSYGYNVDIEKDFNIQNSKGIPSEQ